ncbi:LTV1-like protein [Heterocephalus glaber]|uniref:Protein LTV1 homolog n=1 Tax=Heterocephalus glaber TaxID=10181 RepID=G5C885_HETGA|nr:LTV1-like protein [Heterocephalus glaber]
METLAADETVPQRVLLPTQKINAEERRAEQRKYGVFFDDDYDYLQHLQKISGSSELIPNHTSIMRRNEQLTLHDERFEKFYEQYDDVKIGALGNAELEGSNCLQEVLNDYHKEKAENCIKLNTLEPFEDQDLPLNELESLKKRLLL